MGIPLDAERQDQLALDKMIAAMMNIACGDRTILRSRADFETIRLRAGFVAYLNPLHNADCTGFELHSLADLPPARQCGLRSALVGLNTNTAHDKLSAASSQLVFRT